MSQSALHVPFNTQPPKLLHGIMGKRRFKSHTTFYIFFAFLPSSFNGIQHSFSKINIHYTIHIQFNLHKKLLTCMKNTNLNVLKNLLI